LAFILAFSLDHSDPLVMTFDSYVSMCEGGWNTTLVIQTGRDWSDKMRRYARYRTYCYRINGYIPIRYSIHPASVGNNLSAMHRRYVASELDNFDMFLYHEDDIMVKPSHVNGYLVETKRLAELNPDYLLNHTLGEPQVTPVIRWIFTEP
jgi:hypothetical protein